MEFFNSAIEVLQTLVVALGAGLGVWGAINLLEGYGNDNPGSKSQGMKQLMAGGGVALVGITLIPLLSGLLRTAGGDCRPVHTIIRKAIVTISHREGEAVERDFIVSWQ